MRILFWVGFFLVACRPAGSPCVFASSKCDANDILVTCESTGGGAGSGTIKRTPCGEKSDCLEQRSPGGTIGASCEEVLEKTCDPQSFASRCDGDGFAIICETFTTGNAVIRSACGEFMSCQTDTAGKSSCQPKNP